MIENFYMAILLGSFALIGTLFTTLALYIISGTNEKIVALTETLKSCKIDLKETIEEVKTRVTKLEDRS